MWLENCSTQNASIKSPASFNPSSSGCGWKTQNAFRVALCGRGFQSFFFWMWLENASCDNRLNSLCRVSILLLLDVAGKRTGAGTGGSIDAGFNPSSSGCGWKTCVAGTTGIVKVVVSILLLLDVAGKQTWSFGVDNSDAEFQSFFFWMWLENAFCCFGHGL